MNTFEFIAIPERRHGLGVGSKSSIIAQLFPLFWPDMARQCYVQNVDGNIKPCSCILAVESPAVYIYIYTYMHPSIHPYIQYYMHIYLSTYLSIYLSIYSIIHLSIYPSIYLSIHLSIYRSIHLSIYLSIYLSICVYH